MSSQSGWSSANAPQTTSHGTALPASQYAYAQLAEIYNEARVDYIVPMPMNARRMQEYVESYDIDLDSSVVALNPEGLESGVGMLGLRDHRAWITRLGVLPHRRHHHLGQFLMESMLNTARASGASLAQLEVIIGNDPARRLFEKLGFEDVRVLLVIRRPPGMPAPHAPYDAASIAAIPREELPGYLAQRAPGASWIEENASLLNVSNLEGLTVTMPNGEIGWVIYQRSAFQLTHLVVSPGVSDDTAAATLYNLHKTFPMQDTKVENVPLNDHQWQIYQDIGYIEVFRRMEMVLTFD